MIDKPDMRDIYHRMATYKHDCVSLLEEAIVILFEGATEERLKNLKIGTQALMNHCDYVLSKIKPDNEQPAENFDGKQKSRFQQ